MTERRCVTVYLGVVLLTLITGCRSQCEDNSKVRVLRANSSRVGNIFSPGYPDAYPDKVQCRWKLYTDPGYVIHVHVAWLEMEESVNCGLDNLILYNGQTVYNQPMAKLCHSELGIRDFYSSSNYMYITFTSDFSITGDGFLLEYSAIRPWQIPTTTSRPIDHYWYTSSTHSATTSSPEYRWPSKDIAALIGGLTGGLLLLFVLCALCRYYYGRYRTSGTRQTARPYYPPHPSASSPPGPPTQPSTIYQNSNAVFMVSSSSHHHHHLHPSSAYGGATNMGFSPYGEAPPAYFAVQHSTTAVVQPGSGRSGVPGVGICPPPPSYTEAMRLSHPPAPGPVPLGPAVPLSAGTGGSFPAQPHTEPTSPQ